jgi:hypothetical protein
LHARQAIDQPDDFPHMAPAIKATRIVFRASQCSPDSIYIYSTWGVISNIRLTAIAHPLS